jgi:hypothetical protein
LWVDIDKAKHAVCGVDYTAVAGHDPEKFDAILNRALEKENVADKKELIMFILIGLTIILSFAAAYLGYQCFNHIQALEANIPNWIDAGKAVIVANVTR